jgi:hypothetical protein
MTTITKALAKGSIATIAAGAMAMAAAAPVNAQIRDRDRDRGRDDGISAGEVIAGAVVLGGIAAVIAATSNNNRDRDYRGNDRDYRGNDRDYRGGYNGYSSRAAVDQCVRAAEQQAQRRTGVQSEVYEIRNIDRQRNGFEVEGRIAVRNDYRGRGWNNNYQRGVRNAGWNEGRFTCDWRSGRVTDIDYSGIRNL